MTCSAIDNNIGELRRERKHRRSNCWLPARIVSERGLPGRIVIGSCHDGRRTMATSTCAKCEGHIFELCEQLPAGAAHKLLFVQCAVCGTPAGIVAVHDTAALLMKQAAAIEELKSQVSEIDAGLRRIVEYLNNG